MLMATAFRRRATIAAAGWWRCCHALLGGIAGTMTAVAAYQRRARAIDAISYRVCRNITP